MSNATTNKNEKIQEILGKYRKAGEITKGAKELARKLVIPGANTYEICEEIENYMRKKGAKPAFPTNISFDNEAAHYSAEIFDDRVVHDTAIVKLDLGAHVDGYIVDTAITINHNPKLDTLTQASKLALDKAIELIKPGVNIYTIGKAVEETIMKEGFEPVRNLSGHQIKRYVLHAGVSIPNCGPGYFEKEKATFEKGRVYAIEPFASTGKGWIKNGKTTNIFRFVGQPRRKDADLKEVYEEYKRKVGVLPFSPRMVHDRKSGEEGKKEVMKNLRRMLQSKIIMGYPVLIEEDKQALISQHEHTLRVTSNGVEIFT